MKVNLAVIKDIHGGLALCVEDKNRSTGIRIAGGKISGGSKVEKWVVDVEELIKWVNHESYDKEETHE